MSRIRGSYVATGFAGALPGRWVGRHQVGTRVDVRDLSIPFKLG